MEPEMEPIEMFWAVFGGGWGAFRAVLGAVFGWRLGRPISRRAARGSAGATAADAARPYRCG